jgi:hypothetical protein
MNYGGNGSPLVRQSSVTTLVNISSKTLFPALRISADVTTALCVINCYTFAMEVMAGQSSIGL